MAESPSPWNFFLVGHLSLLEFPYFPLKVLPCDNSYLLEFPETCHGMGVGVFLNCASLDICHEVTEGCI